MAPDIGEAIPWKDGFIRDEPVRLAFVALVADGYVMEIPTDDGRLCRARPSAP
jgi:hypothetical protein